MGKRKSYTIKEKLNLILDFKKSSIAKRAFAKANNIDESTLRLWLKTEENLQHLATSTIASIRKIKRIPRVKIPKFMQIDKQVLAWVKLQNNNGIHVKDVLICSEAKRIRDELIEEAEDADDKEYYSNFQASKMWLHRFKGRNPLVSRRSTTTHSLPDNSQQ